MNLYAFCNNDPVNCIDPDGRDWIYVGKEDAFMLATFLQASYHFPVNGWVFQSNQFGLSLAEDIMYARRGAGIAVQGAGATMFFGGASLGVVGGSLETVAGVAYTLETGGVGGVLGGGLLVSNGIDNVQAGIRTISSGEYKQAGLEAFLTRHAGEGIVGGDGLYLAAQLGIGGIPSLSRWLGPRIPSRWNLANYHYIESYNSGGVRLGYRESENMAEAIADRLIVTNVERDFGNEFNRLRRPVYEARGGVSELYLKLPDGRYAILDNYIPGQEIVSRKYTQLSQIEPASAIEYLNDLALQYAQGRIIMSVPSSGGLELATFSR